MVGQASCSTDSQLAIVPVVEDVEDSDDDILESSQEPFVSTADYLNRRDLISEKPPEGRTLHHNISSDDIRETHLSPC